MEKDRCALVLSNFSHEGWRMTTSKVNLDLNHILVAGERQEKKSVEGERSDRGNEKN